MKYKNYFKNIKVLVFDFDGVILDTSIIKSKTFREVYKEYPHFFSKIWNYHLSNKGSSRKIQFDYLVKNLIGESGKKADLHVKKLMSIYKKKVIPKLMKAKYIKNVLKVIKFSRTKYPLYIVTNSPEDEINIIFKTKKISKSFKEIYSSKNGINKSRIINKIIKIEKVTANSTMFIGDTSKDQISAKKSRVKFIGIKNNFSNFLKDYGIIVTRMDEIYNELIKLKYQSNI